MATPAPATPGSPPTLPTTNDPESTFDALWDAFNAWLTTVLWPYLAAVVSGTAANATEAEAAAVTATAQALAAQTAASASAGAAAFKGLWPSLAGALARPASVKHNNRFWLLLSDLPDVAAAEPGVHAAWTPMDVGNRPTQLVTAGGTVAALVGVTYIVAASSVTLTAPAAGLLRGDYHGVRVMSGVTGFVWDFGGTKVRTLTPGALPWDLGTTPVDLIFEDATRGYI